MFIVKSKVPKTGCHMDILLTILESFWVVGFQLSHKKCLLSLIVALQRLMTVNLLELSRNAFPKVSALSGVRRIERLLSMQVFSVARIGIAILKTLVPQEKYILTMDRTTWELGKRVYNILAIGICFDGISLPIYFRSLDKRGATNFTEQIDFMENVLDLIPAEKIECLVADREFGYTNFMRWLEIRKIPFTLRVRESCVVRIPSSKKVRTLKSLLSSLRVGEHMILSKTFIISGRLRVRIYAVRRKGRGEDNLLILATPVKSAFTDKIYRLRWKIETTFRALKSGGFEIEQSHLPLDGRFQNMLAIIFIAYASIFIEGLVKAKKHSIPIMKSNGRKRYSIFTWGMRFIFTEIWERTPAELERLCQNSA